MPCNGPGGGPGPLTARLDDLGKELDRVPAAAKQGHDHAEHDGQAVGLALGFDQGARVVPSAAAAEGGGDQHEGQGGRRLAPVQLHDDDAES